MHAYAVDVRERAAIFYTLAFISVILVYLLQIYLPIAWPWWLGPPSVFGIFKIMLEFWDRWLWRASILRKLRLIQTPYIGGKWYVEGKSMTAAKEFTAELEIRQNWTTMVVRMETEESSSHSVAASLVIDGGGRKILIYHYANEPKPNASPKMRGHRGTAILRISDSETLEGEYYTGRGRENWGVLKARKYRGAENGVSSKGLARPN